MTTTRAPLSFEQQAIADFNVLRVLVGEVLEADHGIPRTHAEHVNDIAVSLARAAPALPGDVAMLVGLGQTQGARAAVAEGLVTLRALDEYAFHGSPSPRRLGMLTMVALDGNDWESAVTNAELDSIDIRRRNFAQLCRRMAASGNEHKIPSEADAALTPKVKPGHGGIRASRSQVPLHWVKPERT